MSYAPKGEWVCDSRFFVPPVTFTERYLAIKATLPSAKTTWNKAADIYQFVDINGIGKLISPKRAFLPLGRLVEISLAPSTSEYQIQVELPIWVTPEQVTLTIYESNMPTFSEFTPTVNSNQTNNKSPTAVAASTTISTVAANPARKGLVVRNRGNQTVYMGFNDPALTVATAAEGIIGGDNYEMLNNCWTGALQFITQSGTTNLVVTELF